MSNLSINEENGILLVDSRLLAQELGIQHRSFYQKLILKYQKEIEEDWGVVRFESAKPLENSQGGRPEKYAYLTEQQSYLVLTYSKNTLEARQCKRKLVKAFTKAKKVIPAKAQEIEKLKLQLQVAIAQSRLLAASSTLAMIDPVLPALVLGKPEAVVTKIEVVEKTVLVNERGKSRVSYEGLSKTKLAKRYGMKKASDLENWLRSIGKETLLQPGLIATPCQYVPVEKIQELDRLWSARTGTRQFLLGEIQ
jgi:anti-repressor protein